jgi:molybdopterin biosynthesis enzyme
MALPPGPRWLKATLTADITYKTDRPTYHPAALALADRGWNVRTVPWFGSPDLRGVSAGNALALLDEGEGVHRAGEALTVLPLEQWDF